MNQSPLFTEECRKRLSPLCDRGFITVPDMADDDWAFLTWKRDDIRISISYHAYEYNIKTYIYYRERELNVRKLYEQAGIAARERYEFCNRNMKMRLIQGDN